MYQNVLVPVDGSSFSEHAVLYASAIARNASARLYLVLVHTPLTEMAADFAPTAAIQQLEDQHRDAEARYLDELVERLKMEEVDAVAEKLEGDVAARLVERTKTDIDLLVMTTHGRAGLERAWLGSVAEEVVHHIELPALLIRPDDGEPSADEPQFGHVLVATDGSDAARAATEEAVRIARAFEAKLTLVRVVSVPAGLSSPYIPHAALLDREATQEREDQALEFLDQQAAELAGEASVETRVVRAYHPARGILDAISETGCDLVALGTHRRTRLARVVLGSVADKVVRASPVPVLVGHSAS